MSQSLLATGLDRTVRVLSLLRSVGVPPAVASDVALADLMLRVPDFTPRCAKNSSADLRGSRNKSDITATESAPASITDRALARVIPPIATSGLRVNCRARRTPSKPTTGSGHSLLAVANTGPIAT